MIPKVAVESKHQPEAMQLYRRNVYVEIGPFGDYREDPLSVFMEKRVN